MIQRSLHIAEKQTKIELLHTKVDKKVALLENSHKNFQEDSRVLGVLFREKFASPWGWHSARGHKLPNLHKRVKFEDRIKGFSVEWENFVEGIF